MRERNDKVVAIAILMLMVVTCITLVWTTYNHETIRDLQQRVGQLESERR